jgi:hypothetical protein
VQRVIFHLLGEPVPALADPFPPDDPLPGAYELHLPTDGVTICAGGVTHRGHAVPPGLGRCHRKSQADTGRRTSDKDNWLAGHVSPPFEQVSG